MESNIPIDILHLFRAAFIVELLAMKIFVTGATGYIGQQLTAQLLEQGHTVHALCRSLPKGSLYEHPNLKVFFGDLSNRYALAYAMEGCSQVYHLAAYARPWAKHKETFFEINVTGTVNVLDAALATGVEKVVYSSTGATFGTSNGKAVTEESVRKTDFFTEYESSKFIAEERIEHYALKGLHGVIVHPCKVYGPGLWSESNAVSHLIKMYVEGNWHVIPGDGKALGSFSFIDDVVEGHLLAMQHGRKGERYILGGENVSFNEFFSTLKRVSGKDYFMTHVPMPLMLLFALKEEIGTLFGKEPLITRKWVKKYNYNLECSSEKSIHELGYKITPLEEGLTKTLKWLSEEKKVFF
jgi:farnesol dehydrogenase